MKFEKFIVGNNFFLAAITIFAIILKKLTIVYISHNFVATLGPIFMFLNSSVRHDFCVIVCKKIKIIKLHR